MSRPKRKLTITLDISEWVLLRNKLYDCMGKGNEGLFDSLGELIDDKLTDCIDDFHDLH